MRLQMFVVILFPVVLMFCSESTENHSTTNNAQVSASNDKQQNQIVEGVASGFDLCGSWGIVSEYSSRRGLHHRGVYR